MHLFEQLQKAQLRRGSQPLATCRLFHGPGEGEGEFKKITIDKFQEHAWVSCEGESLPQALLNELTETLRKLDFVSGTIIYRQRKGDQTQPAIVLFGQPPEKYVVENCGLKFELNLKNQRQPGLFLDMNLAREWLKQNSKNKNVLNLFSYTGSLSVAAGAGGAQKVTSIDLSKTYTDWAKRNWRLNDLPSEKADFLFGDVFDWLKRFKKQKRSFDIVVCDPPSFSRTKSGHFSTTKDLCDLHQMIFDVLAEGGTVVSSINSENISRDEFLRQITAAADAKEKKISILKEFSLPEDFPAKTPRDSYLKGVILQAMTKE